jgi:hypothetical protein
VVSSFAILEGEWVELSTGLLLLLKEISIESKCLDLGGFVTVGW